MRLVWHERAWEEYLSWQLEDTAYPLSAYRIQVFEENSDIP